MKKRLICFILVICFSFISINISAVDADASVSVDYGEKLITVNGIAKSDYVTMYILSSGETVENISEDSKIVKNIAQIPVNSNGEYDWQMGYKGEPDFTVCLMVDGKHIYKDVVWEKYAAGLGDIFGLLKSFDALYGDSTRERFFSARKELPSEMPVYTHFEVKGSKSIFVDPTSENGDGSIEKPYSSLQDAVNKAKNSPSDCVIYLRGGEYDDRQITYLSSINATSEKPLIISAYNGEKVNFTAGTQIDNSKFIKISDRDVLEKLPIESAGNVFGIDLSELGLETNPDILNTVFSIDGMLYQPARWPDATETKMIKYTGQNGENGVIDSGPITVSSGSACGDYREKGKEGQDGFEICIEDNVPFSWTETEEIYMYGSFYEEWHKATVKVKELNSAEKSVRTYDGCSWGAKYNSANSFYFFNILEELSAPCEWYIDKNNEMLYFYPHKENPESAVLGFGASEVISLTNCSNIIFNDINFVCGNGKQINISNCENILVQDCSFEDVTNGVYISGESKFCGVINSRFDNCETPINISQPPVTSAMMKNLVPQYNCIQNNYVYGSGAVTVRGNANIVSHNVVSNSAGTGIYSDSGHEIIIEYNEIAYGNRNIIDSGAIYVGGNRLASGGNHVRYNYIHHCGEDRTSPNGIYFDDFMSRSYIYGNILEGSNIFIHNGSDNAVYNNILKDVNGYCISDSDNYLKNFEERWKTGALEYGAFTEFLNVNGNVYIDVVSQNSAYAVRYPMLKDWAEKMQQRIAEYQVNGIVSGSSYEATYKNGERSDLDTYLRSPRYNYYGNNVMITENIDIKMTEAGLISAELADNLTYGKAQSPVKDGYSTESYDNIRKDNENFEDIPFDTVGLIDNVLFEHKEPEIIYPQNGAIVQKEQLYFKWKSGVGNSINIIEIADNKEMNNPVVTQTTRNSEMLLNDEQTGALEDGKKYYWRISSQTGTSGTDVRSVYSEIQTFTTDGLNTVWSYPMGIAVQQVNKGKTLNITISTYNKSSYDISDARIYVAGYNKKGELIEIYMSEQTCFYAQEFSENVTVELTKGEDIENIKIFLWNDNLRAYSKAESAQI